MNVSHQWHGPRGHWWQGEPGLYHSDCSTVAHAHAKCLCAYPVLDHGDYGSCTRCGKYRGWHCHPTPADRILAALPHGARITPSVRDDLNLTRSADPQ